jgi:CubicO group peptidase (beta-lactamase class C family)
MAKLGQLMLTDGQWKGRQVLAAGWAAESAKPRIAGASSYFYGYMWWLGRGLVEGRYAVLNALVLPAVRD